MVLGIIFSGCENIKITKGMVDKLNSIHGAAIGFAINNKCKDICVEDVKIVDIKSSSNVTDITTFIVDKETNDIFVNNLFMNPQ